MVSLAFLLFQVVTVSALQVTHGEVIEMKASGFAPNRIVISHLRKPDNSEHPVLAFRTNDRGEFSHTIETVLLLHGTYELWVFDETSKSTSNIARFTVGFGDASRPAPETEKAVAKFAGVWSSPETMITLTGKVGPAAGTVAYPASSCGGILAFRRIYPDSIELSETLKYGLDRCPANVVWILKLASDGALTYESRRLDAEGRSTGKLHFLKD